MKALRLKRIVLRNEANVRVLGDKEMKSIVGGYGDSFVGGLFFCSCDVEGANPPFKSSWSSYYFSSEDMASAISKICKRNGSCRNSGY